MATTRFHDAERPGSGAQASGNAACLRPLQPEVRPAQLPQAFCQRSSGSHLLRLGNTRELIVVAQPASRPTATSHSPALAKAARLQLAKAHDSTRMGCEMQTPRPQRAVSFSEGPSHMRLNSGLVFECETDAKPTTQTARGMRLIWLGKNTPTGRRARRTMSHWRSSMRRRLPPRRR
jgi:hypothetical protein